MMRCGRVELAGARRHTGWADSRRHAAAVSEEVCCTAEIRARHAARIPVSLRGMLADDERSGIRHPASGIRHPASGIRHPASY
jgi:hypothetical protein